MTRSQLTIANNSIIHPTIKYSLATTSFTDEMIDALQKSIHPTVISGMEYSSRCPKELRYSLHYHCSWNIQHYELEQLLSKIAAIHKIVNQNEYKYLFTNMIDSYQIASETTTPILKTPAWKLRQSLPLAVSWS